MALEDKYQWLEDIDAARVLAFVNAQSKATIEKLSKEKNYHSIYDNTLGISNSAEGYCISNNSRKTGVQFLEKQRPGKGYFGEDVY